MFPESRAKMVPVSTSPAFVVPSVMWGYKSREGSNECVSGRVMPFVVSSTSLARRKCCRPIKCQALGHTQPKKHAIFGTILDIFPFQNHRFIIGVVLGYHGRMALGFAKCS